jgi:hypothetical protein
VVAAIKCKQLVHRFHHLLLHIAELILQLLQLLLLPSLQPGHPQPLPLPLLLLLPWRRRLT